MDFRFTGEVGEKMAGKWDKSPENGSKMSFLVHFSFFQPFFGEATTHFLAIVPRFRAALLRFSSIATMSGTSRGSSRSLEAPLGMPLAVPLEVPLEVPLLACTLSWALERPPYSPRTPPPRQ